MHFWTFEAHLKCTRCKDADLWQIIQFVISLWKKGKKNIVSYLEIIKKLSADLWVIGQKKRTHCLSGIFQASCFNWELKWMLLLLRSIWCKNHSLSHWILFRVPVWTWAQHLITSSHKAKRKWVRVRGSTSHPEHISGAYRLWDQGQGSCVTTSVRCGEYAVDQKSWRHSWSYWGLHKAPFRTGRHFVSLTSLFFSLSLSEGNPLTNH